MKRYLVILLGIFTACNPSKEKKDRGSESGINYRVVTFSDEDVPVRIPLVGRKYAFEEIFVPESILLVNGMLVIGDRYDKSMIHLIDVANNRYIRKYGKSGEGPGEMGPVSNLLLGNSAGSFWAYSGNVKRLSEFNVNDTSVLASRQILQQGDFYQAFEITWSSDSTLMAIRTDGEEKFVEFNINGKIINTFGSWNGMIDEEAPHNIIISLHQGSIVSSPDKSIFLKTCVQRDLIEIFRRKTRDIISIRGPENKIPKFTIDFSAGYAMPVMGKNFQLFYANGFIGSEFIYCLYSGQFTEDLAKWGDYNKKIYVFSPEGVIKAVFELDHSLYNFTIDEKRNKIYGVTYDRDPNIVEFNLPKINND